MYVDVCIYIYICIYIYTLDRRVLQVQEGFRICVEDLSHTPTPRLGPYGRPIPRALLVGLSLGPYW